jgi:hypothetical protein
MTSRRTVSTEACNDVAAAPVDALANYIDTGEVANSKVIPPLEEALCSGHVGATNAALNRIVRAAGVRGIRIRAITNPTQLNASPSDATFICSVGTAVPVHLDERATF